MSSEIVAGIVDSDPISADPSFLVDADTTLGEIGDAVPGNFIRMLDGLASNTLFTIASVNQGKNRFKVNIDLFSAGVRLGDSYRVEDSFFDLYDDVNTINTDRVDPDSADSVLLQNDIRNRLSVLENMLRGLKLLEGKIDAISGTTITINTPSFGDVCLINTNHITEITLSKNAERKRFRVLSTTTTDIVHNENLEDEGVVVGDSIRVIHGLTALQVGGHTHDGVDSVAINQVNINPYALWGGMF